MKRKFRLSFVLMLGILLLATGLIGLATVPDLLQYVYLSPAGQESFAPEASDPDGTAPVKTALAESPVDKFDKAMETMRTAFPSLTMHGVKSDAKLSNGNTMKSVYLYSVGPNWNDVYTPQIVQGRPLVRMDAEKENKVVVLDEDTAFTFFGSGTDPIGQIVEVDGQKMQVVGIAAHSRKIGEPQENAAWIPLTRYEGNDLMVLSVPADSADMYSVFDSQTKSSFGNGTVISTIREKTMAMLPLLVVFVIVAIWLIKHLFRWIGEYGKTQIEKVRAESKRRYALQLIPYAAGQLIVPALLSVLAVAACYGIAMLAIHPLTIFPEWIPDTLGEYTSWISRFWILVGQAAAPVNLRTPELGQIQLWQGMILWGTLLILLWAAKNTLSGFRKRKED